MGAASTYSGRGRTAAEAPSGSFDPLLLAEVGAGAVGVDLAALAGFVDGAGPLAVVDLETTGLPEDGRAEILELGLVLLDPGRDGLRMLSSFARPRGAIPGAVERLTGIGEADVAGAPRIESLAPAVARALSGRCILAHNADFERHFLARFVSSELARATFLDTQDLLGLTHPDAADLRLETFVRALLGRDERHRALDDALDTLRVLSRAARGAGERRYAVARSALERYAPDSPWLWLLSKELPPPPGESAPQFVAIAASREPRVPFDEDTIAAVLADADRGRRHFPGYRVRSEQIELARRFARLLADGGRLLLEGGTGVGKSLAYLAAAIPFAMERAAGGVRDPVVISTRTRILQDQLLEKDIPAAAAMLGYADLRALSIKGRANYVCSRRLELVLSEGGDGSLLPEDRLAHAALQSCARIRRHGEVGTLPAALLRRFPPLRDLRYRAVAARAEQCSREQCARERWCPFGRRRAALAKAQLVVANHDLLLRWPPDYPSFTHAVVDEAHELPGVADEVYALEVRPREILERTDDLFGPRSRWRAELSQDLVALGRSLGGRANEYGELQLPLYANAVLPDAAELAERAADRVAAAADEAEELQREGAEPGEAAQRAIADLRAAAAGLRDAFAGSEDAVAAFEGLAPADDRWRLAVRPVAPAEAFHERFAARLEGLACVSASLFVGGDPFAALGELEIEARSELPVTRGSVESPFPYAEQMRVVALAGGGDLVEETADVLVDLARLLGGRTLGLFTSLRRMREVAERVAARLRGDGLDVLMPRRATDDPAALVERFRRAGSGAVLLGARTFWQGIDIPGPALQAVVIEKLPFEVPTELRRRREARVRAAGEDPFERYALGKMLLNLKQMAGRLVRSEEDRGIVVIVEGRADRRYFRRLGEALPAPLEVLVAERSELPRLLAEVGALAGRDAGRGSQGSQWR